MEDIAESIVKDEDGFFAPGYADVTAHLNKYGDVVIRQESSTIFIRRDDFADMVKYLMVEWDFLDECEGDN